MIHARKDYMRIQDPLNKIGVNEPVFIVRAHDYFSVTAMRAWADAVLLEADIQDNKELKEMAAMIYEHIALTLQWQIEHGCKNPDL